MEWYRSHFPVLSGRRKLVTGEASPYYLFHPRAAERASEVVPDARLISMLRNPVDRAYSHYRAQIKRVHENQSFEEALEEDLKVLQEIVDFLELPSWEPPSIEARNKGKYEEPMNPETRQWLEQYYEPHNHRLYEYLGMDFGW